MSLERILICRCGHYLEVHGKRGCVAYQRPDDARQCICMLTRREIVDLLVSIEREEIRAQWSDAQRAS